MIFYRNRIFAKHPLLPLWGTQGRFGYGMIIEVLKKTLSTPPFMEGGESRRYSRN
jgi:hypothetical protein